MSEGVVPIAAAVVLHAGRVLVQTRGPGRSWSGHWEFPGGKLERGEDAAAAAVRECREELGLEVRVLEPLQDVEWSYPGARVRVSFLLCEPAEASTGATVVAGATGAIDATGVTGAIGATALPLARPTEGQEVRWADAEELSRLQFLPANAAVLVLVAARLRGGGCGPAPTACATG